MNENAQPGLPAHVGPQAPALDPVHVRAPIFSPTSGPPGTTVTVRSQDLPALTPMYLGMGATRSSFEVLAELVTDERGEMEEVVSVPSWATSDRTHYFVLVDVYFRPLAVSRAFHVTSPNGTLVRRGRIADEGAGCLTLREQLPEDAEAPEVYALVGSIEGLGPGDVVAVTGRVVEGAGCSGGTTIDVDRADP